MRIPTAASDSPESGPTSPDSTGSNTQINNTKTSRACPAAASAGTTGATPSERQQCWECRRRRLVCDGAQPVCSKCRAAGIVCPGYADKKPLTWLAPGQVMSRTRRKKSPAANPKSRTTDRKVTVTQRPKGRNHGKTLANSTDSMTPQEQKEQMQQQRRAAAARRRRPSAVVPAEAAVGLLLHPPAENEGQLQDDRWFGRPVDLRPEVVDVFEAMMYYNSHIYPQIEQSLLGPSGFLVPMVLLEGVPPSITHTLVSVVISHRIIQTADDPTTCQLVKPLWTRLYRHRDIAVREITRLIGNEKTRTHAVTITAVYALLFAMLQQSFTPCWRTHIEAYVNLLRSWGSFSDIIRDVPYMQLSLMALFIANIFANTTSPRDDQFHSTSTAETFRLIQSFYGETYYPQVACPTPLFTEIVLISDLRTGAPSPQTTRAARRILARIQAFDAQAWGEDHETFQEEWLLLGGLYREAVALYAILGLQSSGAFPGGEYTPGRATEAEVEAEVPGVSVPRVVEEYVDGYDDIDAHEQPIYDFDTADASTPGYPTPSSSSFAATFGPSPPPGLSSSPTSSSINLNINPDVLSSPDLPTTSSPDSSSPNLASTSITDDEELTLTLSLARASHARRLFALLEEAVHIPRVKKRMTWPLVVAGVEAARAGHEVQRWIGSRLDELSRDQGGATPRVGKAVLERYWATGGEGGWDGCFVEPLCLII